MVREASACCWRLTASHVYWPESSGVTPYSVNLPPLTTDRSPSMMTSPSLDHVTWMSSVTSPPTTHRRVTLSPRVKLVTSSGVVKATENSPAHSGRYLSHLWTGDIVSVSSVSILSALLVLSERCFVPSQTAVPCSRILPQTFFGGLYADWRIINGHFWNVNHLMPTVHCCHAICTVSQNTSTIRPIFVITTSYFHEIWQFLAQRWQTV